MKSIRNAVRASIVVFAFVASTAAVASETCVEDVTRRAGIEYAAAIRTFNAMAQSVIREQVAMLQRVRLALTGEDVRLLLDSADLDEVIPLDLEQKIDRLQSSFLEVHCMRGERVFYEDEWSCLHAPEYAAEEGVYPTFVKDLTLDGTYFYACVEYVTREGVSPAVDAYSCAMLDLETGEIHGSNPMDSINGDVVDAYVFAYVSDVPLHQSAGDYARHLVDAECAQ